MKTTIQRFILALLMASMSVGCTTAYDAYGYPRPVVDPGVAILGAAAAGLAGYSIGRSRHRHRHHDHHCARYHRHGHHFYH
jgi:hypothetical protein